MRKASVTALVMFLVACAAKDQKKVEQEIKQPINCATARGDIRMLQHEKAHVRQEIAEGVTAIFPAGLVVGVVSLLEMEMGSDHGERLVPLRIYAKKSQRFLGLK